MAVVPRSGTHRASGPSVVRLGGTALGLTLLLLMLSARGAVALPDGRGWEMVSPVTKNGGQVDPPETIAGGGVLQASSDGSAVTYGSAASFGEGSQGAPPASQYLARRGAGGWSSENIAVPLFSGSYGTADEGVPYQLFSTDLARGLVLNGRHCRGGGEGCAVANPPPAGTGAPAGFQNYYLRENTTGGFAALLGPADLAGSALEPAEFDVVLAGTSPDLRHLVLTSCAALTPDATEVPLGEGCDPEKANLYEWSQGVGLSLVNLLPGESEGTPGAVLGAQAAAISDDGSRVYWNDLGSGDLHLREGGQTVRVDEAAGGGGRFETAATDGSIAYFTAAGHLYRYSATSHSAVDLTPAGGVKGVLGASATGDSVYYVDAAGLFLWHDGMATKAAADADASNYPPTTGTARVSPDGTHLVFVSIEPLTGFDNTDRKTGEPDSEVFLYDATTGFLACSSCRTSATSPIGPSSIPGSVPNGEGTDATNSYKPRVLSPDGRRLFFDSRDALVSTDTNNDRDVYQWEALGSGDCTRSGGCVTLISSGRAEGGASFVDASLDGADVFFLTDGSLVKSDPGSVDLYDARIGGGFPEAETPIPCEGNACQGLLSEPVDPALNTQLEGLGNPKVHYRGEGKKCRRGFVKRRGKCVKKGKRSRGKGSRAGGGR